MNNEQIAQEIRELSDRLDALTLSVDELSARSPGSRSRPSGWEPPFVASRLADQDRRLLKCAEEVEGLSQIVNRLTDRLDLLEKGWE